MQFCQLNIYRFRGSLLDFRDSYMIKNIARSLRRALTPYIGIGMCRGKVKNGGGGSGTSSSVKMGSPELTL